MGLLNRYIHCFHLLPLQAYSFQYIKDRIKILHYSLNAHIVYNIHIFNM